MNAAPLPLVLTSCVIWLAGVPSAQAGPFSRRDDCAPCTRHSRAETDAELCNAKRFESMDCRGLTSYAESYRMRLNQQITATYYRPVAESAPPAGPLPELRTQPVAAPPVKPETTPAASP